MSNLFVLYVIKIDVPITILFKFVKVFQQERDVFFSERKQKLYVIYGFFLAGAEFLGQSLSERSQLLV